MDFVRALWAYWWLRGVAAALSLLVFAREFLGFSPFEAASAILAVLGAWASVLNWLGAVIGRLPMLPALTSDQVLYLSLLMTFSVPAAIQSVRDLRILLDATDRAQRRARIRQALARPELTSGLLAFFRRRALRAQARKLSDGANTTEVVLSFSLFVAAGASTGLLTSLAIRPSLEFGQFTVALLGAAVLVAFTLACRARSYFIGAVTLIGFLGAMQIAFVLDSPWVHDFVHEQAGQAALSRTGD